MAEISKITLPNGITYDIKDTTARANIASAVATETSRAQEAEANRYTKNETYTKEEVNNLITTPNQEYVSVTATEQTTVVTDVLPATGAADTTYRVGNWDGTQYNDSVFSEYAWNGSVYIKLSTKSQIGEVYDISANHADTKYADLAAALNGGVNIPQSLQRGGMSIKFIQSSDNKYVQYRLMSDSFGTIESDWQNIGLVQQTGLSETVAMSQKAVTEKFNIISNTIESLNDKDKGKITWSDFSFAKGVIASDGSYLDKNGRNIAYIYLHDMEVVGKLSLHIKAYKGTDTTAIIGFYSSEEISKDNLLLLVERKNTEEQFEDYDVLIPNGTKMIAVNYRNNLFTDEEIKQITASITYTKNGYIRQYVASVCQGMTKNNYILYDEGGSHFLSLNWGYTKVVTDGKGYDSVLVYEENIPKNYALVAFYSDIETVSKDTYLKKYSVAGTETTGWHEVDIPSEAKLMCIAYANDEAVKNLPGIIISVRNTH